MSDNITVGERIKKIRIDQGHSQENYASLIGISRSLLAQIERDNTKPALSILSNIVRISNVSYSYLIDGADDKIYDKIYDKVMEDNPPKYESMNRSEREKELEKQVEYYRGKVEALMAVISELAKKNTAMELPKKGSKSA